MSRSLLDQLSDETLVGLRIAGDALPRGLLSATLIPDGWMGLVERRDGGRRFVPAGEDPRPARDDRLLLVRNRPITVPLALDDTPAADGHLVSARGELLVRWQPREDDLAALGRTLLASGRLGLEKLADAVCDAGAEPLLRGFVRERPASRLVQDDWRGELLAALRSGLQRFLFSSGLTLEQVANVRFDSESLAREQALQRETASRIARVKASEAVEQAALAATKRRLDDLSTILDKLRSAAAVVAADPRLGRGGGRHLSWHELLPALSPAERGRLLENLWRVTPDRNVAHAIVVVSSRECAWLDPVGADHALRRVSLDDALGGLRSVSFDQGRNLLLVGAGRGVWTLDASDGSIRGRYEVPGVQPPRTGFNAAVIVGDGLFATHSQLGAWYWPLAAPERAEPRFTPVSGSPRTVRAATATEDGWLLFAADEVVHLLRPSGDVAAGLRAGRPPGDNGLTDVGHGVPRLQLPAAPGVIQCLALEGRTLYAGTTGGHLASLHLDRPDGWLILHRAATAFESIFPRRWDDLLELVIPCGRGISGVFAQEGIVVRLMESPVPIRRAWACDDLLAGLSELRDRLAVMRSDAAERRGRVVPVAQMLGHAVQDACIVSRHGGAEA